MILTSAKDAYFTALNSKVSEAIQSTINAKITEAIVDGQFSTTVEIPICLDKKSDCYGHYVIDWIKYHGYNARIAYPVDRSITGDDIKGWPKDKKVPFVIAIGWEPRVSV